VAFCLQRIHKNRRALACVKAFPVGRGQAVKQAENTCLS
ncbi:hypothetical protein D030_3052B, partial [Vibrio parahaemolyticus AQ3810]